MLQEIGLGNVWKNEDVGEEKDWKRLVRKMMGEEEQKQWRSCMGGGGKKRAKVKLLRYMKMKKVLRKEWFLELDRSWVRRWVRMRAGVARLEVEMGRHRGVWRRGRVCRWCDRRKVEDVVHVVDECEYWKKERKGIWAGIGKEGEERYRGRNRKMRGL